MKTFFLKSLATSMVVTVLIIPTVAQAQSAELNKTNDVHYTTKESKETPYTKNSQNNNELVKTLNTLFAKSIEHGANRLCTATSFTIQGISEKDKKPFFFSSDVEDIPKMIQKISKHNKFSKTQLNSFNRIYKISMLANKNGTGFTEQALVNAAETGNFKIDAKIFCVNNFNLYIEPEVSKQ